MFKKKILFSLGSLSLISPVLFTISCGNVVSAEREKAKIESILLSDNMIRIMENSWQEKVLGIKNEIITEKIIEDYYTNKKSESLDRSNLSNNAINIIEWYLSKKIKNDPDWLNKKGNEIIESDYNQKQKVDDGFFNHSFIFKGLDFEDDNSRNKIKNTIQALWTMKNGRFKREIYKILIVKKYLQEANKTNYLKFKNKKENDLNKIEQKYCEDSYALIDAFMEKGNKMFLKWELISKKGFDITAENTKEKTHKQIIDYINTNYFKKGVLSFSSQKQALENHQKLFEIFGDVYVNELLGFKGVYQEDSSVDIQIDILKESEPKSNLLDKLKVHIFISSSTW